MTTPSESRKRLAVLSHQTGFNLTSFDFSTTKNNGGSRLKFIERETTVSDPF